MIVHIHNTFRVRRLIYLHDLHPAILKFILHFTTAIYLDLALHETNGLRGVRLNSSNLGVAQLVCDLLVYLPTLDTILDYVSIHFR